MHTYIPGNAYDYGSVQPYCSMWAWNHPEIFFLFIFLPCNIPFLFMISLVFHDAIFHEALTRGEQCLHHVLIRSCDLTVPQIAMCLHVQSERNDGTLGGF